MDKIYIAGCGGMLGEAFYAQYKDDYQLRCTDIDVNEAWLGHMDFRDLAAYRKDVEAFQPDYLFHLGASTEAMALASRDPFLQRLSAAW